MVAIYYNVIICYALYYLLVSIISFDDNIPWATCDNAWNTDFCINKAFRKISEDMNETMKVNITLGESYGVCVPFIVLGLTLHYK